MLEADQRRLQREADIAKAVGGPDYTLHNESVRAAKAYAAKREAISRDAYNRARAGYYHAVREGRIAPINGPFPHCCFGKV